ncbi:MAG: hypothetical protein KatS3mg057_0435 [Herpetosiphonaceae bacterium]|nr:MAG: hypothetical protein KatS3mg057_0435 [Herpetosiphonaceae bacterium]
MNAMHDQRARLSQRIRLFAQLEASAVVIITVAGVLILPAKWFPIVSASLLTLLFSGMLYALRNSRYAELAVYINLVAVILITAALGPATRQLTGVSWVLFQAWPPIAALILRQARASLIVAVIAAVCMVLVFLLQLEGVLPGEQLVPERILWLTLMFQLVVLGLLSTVTMFVSKGEESGAQRGLGGAAAA